MGNEIEMHLEMTRLKSAFARRGLDLKAAWEPVGEDPEVHLRQLRNLLEWVEVYETHRDRETLEEMGYLYPPVHPCIDPESDWLRFERWMAGEPVTHTLRQYLPEDVAFPPAETLSDGDISAKIGLLTKGLEKMGCQLVTNPGIPSRLIYAYLIEYLDKPMEVLGAGVWNLDGCTGYCPECFQRPWCGAGSEIVWQEDEDAGEMFLIDEVREYVSPTRFSLAILRKKDISNQMPHLSGDPF